MHFYLNNSTFSFVVTKKRIYYLAGFLIFLVLFFSIRSKYFERSDFLRPVTRTIKNTAGRVSKSWYRNSNDDIVESIMKENMIDENQNSDIAHTKNVLHLSPWEKWMMENPHLQSVGSIFDRCGK